MEPPYVTAGSLVLICIIGLIVLCMWGCPKYSVYSARKEGEAILAHSVAAKEVKVNEAKATMESAQLLAIADTLRAIGVARANIIIGASINDKYIQWLWVTNLKEQDKTVIYLQSGPMGIPIMEAGRVVPPPVPKVVNLEEK